MNPELLKLRDGKTCYHVMAILLLEELFPRLKKRGIPVKDSPITPEHMAQAGLLKYYGLVTTRDIRKRMDEILA
jgi:hypothetical protein